MHSPGTPERYVDLHLHSTCSDGRWAPRRVVEEAAARGLAAISLTDHDVLDGIPEAAEAARERGLEFLPGVELTAAWDGRTVHILGHGIDPADRPLRAALERGRRLMGEHVERVLAALRAAGEPIGAADLEKYRARYAGGAALVLAIVERGVLRRVADGPALLRLASREPRAYSAAEAIALIHGAGGVASLAHPVKIRRGPAGRPAMPMQAGRPGMLGGAGQALPAEAPAGRTDGAVREAPLRAGDLAPLVAAGLDGLEVWQIVHGPSEQEHFAAVAAELGLLRVGGSDCHGPRRGLGPRIGRRRVPYAAFERLSRALAARAPAPA